MRRRARYLVPVLVVLAAGGAALGLSGCRRVDDGLTARDRVMVDRVDQIAKQSGGDWDRLSQADRDYLVKEVSHGSEPSARMLLLAKSGRLRQGRPGGPASGGAAAGPGPPAGAGR